MIKNILKPFIEKFPAIAYTYRIFRDKRMFESSKSQNTPFGFKFVGNDQMMRGLYQREETEVMLSYLNMSNVFIDIGANIGFYTCLALSKKIYTIAFEPLEQNLLYLFRNLEDNGYEATEIHAIALSDKPGIATMYGGGTGTSLIEGWANPSPLLRRTVPLNTLDNILGERFSQKQLFIKIDVEGAELAVLHGASLTLNRSPAPIWMVEICLREHHPEGANPNFVSRFELFWDHGYEAESVYEQGRAMSRERLECWNSGQLDSYTGNNFLFYKKFF